MAKIDQAAFAPVLSADASARAVPAYVSIAQNIERMMEIGRLKPNDQLPTTAELAKRFDTTLKTTQKGLTLLVRKGLLSRRPGVGTVVTAKPTRIALGIVSSQSLLDGRHDSFSQVAINSLLKVGASYGASVASFPGLDDASFDSRIVDVEDAIAEGKINFIVAIHRSQKLADWLRTRCRVAWAMTPRIDLRLSAYKGASYLLNRNYRNIWMISRFGQTVNEDYEAIRDSEAAGFLDSFKSFGLSPDHLAVKRWGTTPQAVYDAAMRSLADPADRPDAILSHTDHTTPGLILALAHLGLRIPDDIAVVTHKNRGIEILSPVPLTSLVVDPDELAQRVFASLRSNRFHNHEFDDIIEPALEPGESCGECRD